MLNFNKANSELFAKEEIARNGIIPFDFLNELKYVKGYSDDADIMVPVSIDDNPCISEEYATSSSGNTYPKRIFVKNYRYSRQELTKWFYSKYPNGCISFSNLKFTEKECKDDDGKTAFPEYGTFSVECRLYPDRNSPNYASDIGTGFSLEKKSSKAMTNIVESEAMQKAMRNLGLGVFLDWNALYTSLDTYVVDEQPIITEDGNTAIINCPTLYTGRIWCDGVLVREAITTEKDASDSESKEQPVEEKKQPASTKNNEPESKPSSDLADTTESAPKETPAKATTKKSSKKAAPKVKEEAPIAEEEPPKAEEVVPTKEKAKTETAKDSFIASLLDDLSFEDENETVENGTDEDEVAELDAGDVVFEIIEDGDVEELEDIEGGSLIGKKISELKPETLKTLVLDRNMWEDDIPEHVLDAVSAYSQS